MFFLWITQSCCISFACISHGIIEIEWLINLAWKPLGKLISWDFYSHRIYFQIIELPKDALVIWFLFTQNLTNDVSNFQMKMFLPRYNLMSFLRLPIHIIVKQNFQCNFGIDILFVQFNKILYSIWCLIYTIFCFSIVRFINVWIIFFDVASILKKLTFYNR